MGFGLSAEEWKQDVRDGKNSSRFKFSDHNVVEGGWVVDLWLYFEFKLGCVLEVCRLLDPFEEFLS